jgi:hypothetical protein
LVDYCANPNCLKPLLYLREGSIYIFEATDGDLYASSQRSHQLEHYWLCGDCSLVHRLERNSSREIRLIPRKQQRFVRERREEAERLPAAKIA